MRYPKKIKKISKLGKSERAIRYTFEKLAPSHHLHGPGLQVLLKALVREEAKLQGREDVDTRIVQMEESSLAFAAMNVILGSAKSADLSRLKDLEPENQKTILMLRGIYPLAARLSEVSVQEWPEMYIQQDVLALRVPQGSTLMRRHFTRPAKTMGLALLFAHDLEGH